MDRGGAILGARRRGGHTGADGAGERAARAAIFSVFPYPRRLRALTAPLRAAQRTGLDCWLARSSLPERVSPVLGAALGGPGPARRLLGADRCASACRRSVPGRAVIGMLTGCVQSAFFPQANAATARVLAAEGCDVIIPRGQGCCGALSLHSGREAEAATFARRTIALFEQAGVDAVVQFGRMRFGHEGVRAAAEPGRPGME